MGDANTGAIPAGNLTREHLLARVNLFSNGNLTSWQKIMKGRGLDTFFAVQAV